MSFIYALNDTWNNGATTFAGIQLNVSNGAAGSPVAAAASQLINLQLNGTQTFGVRLQHQSLGSDATPFLNMVDVWNTSGNVTGIKYNVTNTASGASSLLMDLQVAGSSKFNVDAANGIVTLLNTSSFRSFAGGFFFLPGGTNTAYLPSNGLRQISTAMVGWTSGSDATASADTLLTRAAAATIQLGAADVDTGPVAQTLRTQGALTGGTSNVAGANWTLLASPSKGNLAGGNFIFQTTPAGGSGSTVNTAVTALTLGAATAFVQPGAGTAAIAALQYTSGTNLTTAQAGAREYDGTQHYATIDTSSGRAALAAEQYFHLTANGGTISTIANFFGTTSNISLVASAHYIIDIEAWFSVQTGTQTVTWTLTNSAAPTSQNIDFMMSPVTGMIAPPGTATMLEGQFQNDATAARTITTGALTSGITVYTRMRIWLINSTGTSLLIQATSSANTITPLAGSWWRCRRVSSGNVGTFHA